MNIRTKIYKFIGLSLVAGMLTPAFCSCEDEDTYAEMRKTEGAQISNFLNNGTRVVDKETGDVTLEVKGPIKVISESEFYANDSVTDVSKNEYVQLASGVYMQIVDKGSENLADTIRPNEVVLVRFSEYSLFDKMVTVSNLETPYMVDEFRYTVTSSSIAGIFSTGTVGAMYYYYGSPTVPAGWLAALAYAMVHT